jgi:hypothetical protein
VYSKGATWRENGITPQRVRELNGPIIRDASPALWDRIEQILAEAEAGGCFG